MGEGTVAMTFEDLDCWKTARLLVNHTYSMTRKGDLTVAAEAVRLRDDVVTVGKLVSGLIRSTESRRSKIRSVVMSIFHLLSS